MFALYVLGTLIEPAIGTLRFLGIYFAALLAGSFGALLRRPERGHRRRQRRDLRPDGRGHS